MTLSLQEIAAGFANNVLPSLNTTIANIMGVNVMWFRATPDKRSQDVIFQSYTLYGVEDCPLSFNAMYSDTGYDDAAITYNIMGLEYSVPLTLEIPVGTWYDITDRDGTIPQRGDIVYIPISNKLVEVVSMTPVKSVAAQLTSYKVNCSVYKPTRSRIVSENLGESIKNNTVNLRSQFGVDINDTIKNIVDTPQLDMFSSTSQDKVKENAKFSGPGQAISTKEVHNIHSYELNVDGHLVARTYYDMNIDYTPVVRYKNIHDEFISGESQRCYSVWININEYEPFKNIKSFEVETTSDSAYIVIKQYSGKKFQVGDNVIIERGNLVICGIVADSSDYKISIDKNIVTMLNRKIPAWTTMPGYIIRKDNIINLLSGNNIEKGKFDISLHGNNYITLSLGDKKFSCQLPIKLKVDKWYGVLLNISGEINIDIFEADGEIKKVASVSNVKLRLDLSGTYDNYEINPSPSKMTNIRYFTKEIIDTDKQLINLLSYNIPESSDAIINDSADLYLNKEFVGIYG